MYFWEHSLPYCACTQNHFRLDQTPSSRSWICPGIQSNRNWAQKWEYGSAVRSTGCFTRKRRCGSQHLRVDLQPCVNPTPADLPPSDFSRHQGVHGALPYIKIKKKRRPCDYFICPCRLTEKRYGTQRRSYWWLLWEALFHCWVLGVRPARCRWEY